MLLMDHILGKDDNGPYQARGPVCVTRFDGIDLSELLMKIGGVCDVV